MEVQSVTVPTTKYSILYTFCELHLLWTVVPSVVTTAVVDSVVVVTETKSKGSVSTDKALSLFENRGSIRISNINIAFS
jgi:hypothetical protein